MFQLKEQDKSAEASPNEMKMCGLPDREFKRVLHKDAH